MSWALTLDVDWAPDFVIDAVRELLVAARVPSTWFLTHDSPAVTRLLQTPLVEHGLHPNFLEGSTQGSNPEAVLSYLTSRFPDTHLARTHSLLQSTPLLVAMREAGITVDVSLFLPGTHCGPHTFFLPNGQLCRIPFHWEDDAALWEPGEQLVLDYTRLDTTPFSIFNFHPIHIYLNLSTPEQYEAFKQARPQTPDEARPFISTRRGIGTFFNELLDEFRQHPERVKTIGTIAKQFLNGGSS